MGLSGIQYWFLTRLRNKLSVAWSSRFVWRMMHLPLGFFMQRSPAELSSRMRLNSMVAHAATGPIASAGLSILTMAIYAVIMVYYDWVLASTAIGFALVNLTLLTLISRALAARSTKLSVSQGRAFATALHGLNILEEYKATGGENLLFERWSNAEAEVINAEQNLGRMQNAIGLAPFAAQGLLNILVLTVGAVRVMENALGIGDLIAIQMLTVLFNAPISQLIHMQNQLMNTAGAMARLNDLYAQPTDGEDASDQPAVDHEALRETLPHGALEIRDLAFAYAPERNVLEGINLNIAPGQMVAILGRSGSGKSTLVRLLARLTRPTAGTIHLDGRDIADLPPELLHGHIAYVDQEIAIFNARIIDNLTLWDEEIDEATVIQAAHDARLHDAITRRPGGYTGRIRFGGGGLSGGEAQRVALARALVLEPSILILDEATSALDTITERDILAGLAKRGCTVILVTHRISAIQHFDTILVLDDGRVVQQGAHEELIAVEGIYRELVG